MGHVRELAAGSSKEDSLEGENHVKWKQLIAISRCDPEQTIASLRQKMVRTGVTRPAHSAVLGSYAAQYRTGAGHNFGQHDLNHMMRALSFANNECCRAGRPSSWILVS